MYADLARGTLRAVETAAKRSIVRSPWVQGLRLAAQLADFMADQRVKHWSAGPWTIPEGWSVVRECPPLHPEDGRRGFAAGANPGGCPGTGSYLNSVYGVFGPFNATLSKIAENRAYAIAPPPFPNRSYGHIARYFERTTGSNAFEAKRRLVPNYGGRVARRVLSRMASQALAGQQVSDGFDPSWHPITSPDVPPAIGVNPDGSVAFEPPTHQVAKPPKGTREKKMRLHLSPKTAAMGFLSAVTNYAELIDCMYKSIPESFRKEFRREEYRSGRHFKGWIPAPQDKARAVWRYLKQVDAGKLAQCIVANEIGDRFYALPGRHLKGLYNAGNFHHGIQAGGGLSGGPDNARLDVSGDVSGFLDWLAASVE